MHSRAFDPVRTALMLVASSGNVVPIETIVAPTTISGMRKICDTPIAVSVR
ncbi:hypothetical protein Hs20B_08390 [Lactococcus insecticola]|uniref:Uncharacterized protein n=1 Tax=Pseudolactococcus insecticola TaxID=2709158 RepID=A0A6A0B7H5_9LACT|nr:hypothetical protein Hs20B_08390 [Lactococcus insecticola]